jgi:hypothetical protein
MWQKMEKKGIRFDPRKRRFFGRPSQKKPFFWGEFIFLKQ